MEQYRDPGTPPLKVEDRNKWFNKLNMRQKKVAVARDVLQQIRIKRIIPKHGVYLKITELGQPSGWDNAIEYNGELQEILMTGRTPDKEKISCHACGIGSVLLGKARLGDDACAYDGTMEREDMVNSLKKVFTRDELGVIEDVFEGDEYDELSGHMSNLNYEPDDRIKFLMKHIIDTKGLPTFDSDLKLPKPR